VILASSRLSDRDRRRATLLELPWPADLPDDELLRRATELLTLGATDEQLRDSLEACGVTTARAEALLQAGHARAAADRLAAARGDQVLGATVLLCGAALVVVSWLTIDDAVLYLPGVAAMVFGVVRIMRGRQSAGMHPDRSRPR
jgi:hypothetical protein